MKTTTTVGWLVIVAVLAVLGVDTYSSVINRVHTENDAQEAALAGSTAYHANANNLQAAYQAAQAAVVGKDETIPTTSFRVDAAGEIYLTVTHTTKTLVFGRIGPLKHFATTTQNGDANSISAG